MVTTYSAIQILKKVSTINTDIVTSGNYEKVPIFFLMENTQVIDSSDNLYIVKIM